RWRIGARTTRWRTCSTFPCRTGWTSIARTSASTSPRCWCATARAASSTSTTPSTSWRRRACWVGCCLSRPCGCTRCCRRHSGPSPVPPTTTRPGHADWRAAGPTPASSARRTPRCAGCPKAASRRRSRRPLHGWSAPSSGTAPGTGSCRSELLAGRQVAPAAHRHLRQRYPADADAPDRDHLQADLRADVAQLARLHALEGEAQAELVLPAHLARGKGAAVELQAVVEPGQPIGRDLAAGFDHELLFDLGEVLGQ